jgi:hypothetical protein
MSKNHGYKNSVDFGKILKIFELSGGKNSNFDQKISNFSEIFISRGIPGQRGSIFSKNLWGGIEANPKNLHF